MSQAHQNCDSGRTTIRPLKVVIRAAQDLEVAVFLAYLVDQHRYHKERSSKKDGWFYCTMADVQSLIGLRRKQQERVLEYLENIGIVETMVVGSPPKRNIRVFMDKYAHFLAWCDAELEKEGNNEN